jgi:hypothetical protein
MISSITPVMLEALCDYLLEKPTLYLREIAIFLWDVFTIYATKSTIIPAPTSKGLSKKAARVKARDHNSDLRKGIPSLYL